MACGIECCGMVDGMNVVVGYVVACGIEYAINRIAKLLSFVIPAPNFASQMYLHTYVNPCRN